MKKVIKLKESDLQRIVKRTIKEQQSFDEHSYEDKLEMIGHEVIMLYVKMEEEKGQEFADNEIHWLLDGILAGTINSSDMESDEGWSGNFTKDKK